MKSIGLRSMPIRMGVEKLHAALRSTPLAVFGITTARVSKGRYLISWRDYRSSVPCGRSRGLLAAVPEHDLIEACAVLLDEMRRVRAAATRRAA